MKKQNVMIDLETLGKRSNAVIIAIGAVVFDEEGIEVDDFYINVDPQSCIDIGMKMDASTVMWWMQQSDEARAVFKKPGFPIQRALMKLSFWLTNHTPVDRRVWGNGSTFDNVILTNAHHLSNMQPAWKYSKDRCYRTLKALLPNIEHERNGIHHNALDDARYQAEHCIKLLKGIAYAQTYVGE